MNVAQTCAIVLAAGSSVRMGSFKPLLEIEGTTLLEHVIRAARSAKIPNIILVLGYRSAEIRSRLYLSGLTVIDNPSFADGMSTSVRAGLQAVPDGTLAAFIMLADMPLVAPATLTKIMEHQHSTKADAVVPEYQGKSGNPVLLSAGVFGRVNELEGDEGFRRVLKSLHRVEVVSVDDPGVLLDCDTPQALEECRKVYLSRKATRL